MVSYNCEYTELVNTSNVKPNEKNPNKHSQKQIELVAKILKDQGFRHPLIVSKLSGKLVVGHCRLESAKFLGLEKVPVDYQEFKDAQEEMKFMIADNKAAIHAEHDDSLMLDNLKELDIDLESFDFDEIGLLDFEFTKEPDEAKEEIEDDVPTDVETRCKQGDLWILGEHRLLCGDSTNVQHVERLMGGEKADMVFTDPPYNINYQGVSDKRDKIKNDKMSDEDFSQFLREALPTAPTMYICCSWQYAHLFKQAMTDLNCKPKAMIVWDKVNPAQHLDKYFKQHEIIFYRGPFGGEKTIRGDIWELKRQRNTVHPTMKPVELIEMALEDNPKCKTIVDHFGGSGSTLIACEKTNRKCYMMELDPHYCDVILKRWEDYSGKQAKLEE